MNYINIILYLFSVLENSFISTLEFLFSLFSPSIPVGRGGVSERLCGAQPPTGLNPSSLKFINIDTLVRGGRSVFSGK